jgi:signal peptidase II
VVRYKNFWLVWSLIFFLDLSSKSWIVENAQKLRYDPIVLIDGISGQEAFLEITYVTNPGAAWSMLSDYPEFLTALAGIALLAIFMFRKHLELSEMPQQLIFGSICGGIAGDFIDIYFPIVSYDYPVFNVADSGIFLGATTYFIWSILEAKNEKLKDELKTS